MQFYDRRYCLLKKSTLAVFLLAAFLFTGCSFGGSVDLLLSPPRLSEEQSAVYNALISSVGKEVKLQYPRAGAYRSAFVFANIDNEPDEEAVVFYEKSGESEGGGNVRINIIDRIDGSWISVYDHAGAGTGIDRIIFSDIGTSGTTSMIIGYTLLSGERSAAVYSYNDGRLYTEYSDSYSTMFVTDIDRDGAEELVLIRPENQIKKAAMSLISGRTEDGSFRETASVALDPNASEFVNIASGYVGTDTPAIFIDGLSGGQLTTEIIYSVNGQLRNPLYLGESAMIENTRRPAGYLCTDIDIDGIIEIPTVSTFPGYSQDSRDSIYSTNWNILDNYNIVKKYSSYYSAANGYCFILPSRWDGVVTVKIDSATGDVVFYKFRIDLTNSTTELMRITSADASETSALLEEGYMVIKSNNNINYLVKSPDIEDEPLVLTMTEISNNFYVMI
ncbi:MAG: hypothetical protein J1E40_02990 [Oscillospiraceae bacterium]|nr:hypothetical protein [Oscillospiraceae bacterium]